jgi:hypothetical protein
LAPWLNRFLGGQLTLLYFLLLFELFLFLLADFVFILLAAFIAHRLSPYFSGGFVGRESGRRPFYPAGLFA